MALMEQVISAAKKPWGLSQCQEVWVADFAWLKEKLACRSALAGYLILPLAVSR
jgi:hypothetical protein